MTDDAVAYLVKWKEGRTNCRRVFLSFDDALGWAARLNRDDCSGGEVVALYERADSAPGAQ